jgi:Cytochrome c
LVAIGEGFILKRWVKIVLILAVVLLVVLSAGAYKILGPRAFLGPRARPLTARTFERTPARLARGKYLMEGVLPCVHCHSPHDWSQHDAAIPAGKEFSGVVINEVGPPGRIVAPNLTPDMETGTGSWPDDALARAIREGVGHDGRALFPMMPYSNFHHFLSDEDLASVIVYLRALPPVHNPLPKTELIFPLKYIVRNLPDPLTAPVPERTFSTPEQRGEYLTRLIGCQDCHTPVGKDHNPISGMEFGGGSVFEGPWGTVASANLTPDPSGIPYFDQALFIRTIHTGYVGSRPLKPIMPWPVFRNMTDGDLSAIFAYLKTVKPVHHRVDNSMTPTLCPIDGGMHGAGNQNRKQ